MRKRNCRNHRFLERLDEFLSLVFKAAWLAKSDLTARSTLSLRDSIASWRCGFKRNMYEAYGLTNPEFDPGNYLSDYQVLAKTSKINGSFVDIIDNKLAFPLLLESLNIPTPTLHGTIQRGKFHPIEEGTFSGTANLIDRYLGRAGQKVALKQIWGCKGTGFMICSRTNDGFQLNADEINESELSRVISALDNYVVVDFVKQGKYSEQLYSDTVNTMRIVTMQDTEGKGAFVAAAVQRIGSTRSYPTDNFRSGYGGLSSVIDLENGMLGPACSRKDDGNIALFSRHPDNDAPIQGISVPFWEKIRQLITAYANQLSFIPYIGWDVVTTDDGIMIIEGNSRSAMPLIQIHGPILTDQRIRRFYEFHGVISAD